MKTDLVPLSTNDREAVTDIVNYYIENSFASYPEEKHPYEAFDMLLKMSEGYPAVTVRDEAGCVIGFGMLRRFSASLAPAFAKTAEITYFLKPEYTGSGIGSLLLEHLLEEAGNMNLTDILAHISSRNEGSIRFHLRHGFEECGRFRNIGTKWEKSFDVVWCQKKLQPDS